MHTPAHTLVVRSRPAACREQDTRTPEELLDLIEEKGREVADALAALRRRL